MSGAVARTTGRDLETRRQVIDAAIACILERGFYRASSNEIARRASMTWGVIQYHFGTREALMLAVLKDGADRFMDLLEDAHVTGATVEVRLDRLLDLLYEHYGRQEYLAWVQVLLNLHHDPNTSDEVRGTLAAVAAESTAHIRRLLGEVLGPEHEDSDVASTLFLVIRGFALSQQLLVSMAYDSIPPEADLIDVQRATLTKMLAPYLSTMCD